MSWDINRCADNSAKVVIPFHYLVQPQTASSDESSRQPFRFLDLPVDLQLIVYEQCDLPTLFQLMRTCSRTRGPANRLFWANPSEDHWFHIDNRALWEYREPNHFIMPYCPEFSRRITKFELDVGPIDFIFRSDDPAMFPESAVTTRIKALHLWSHIGKVFPAVRQVVLTGGQPPLGLPPPAGGFDEDCATIETVVRCAPSHMEVNIAFEVPPMSRPRRYTLWHVPDELHPAWQMADGEWTPKRILLPLRQLYGSPLGDFLTMGRMGYLSFLERCGLDTLLIETYARFARDGVIRCARLDCDRTFAQRSEWEHHLEAMSHWRLGTGYGEDDNPNMELLCFKGTPEPVQAALKARQQRMEVRRRRALTLQRRLGCGFGEEGSAQRRGFTDLLFTQLREENFFYPGQLDKDAADGFLDSFYMLFDKTHVYYAGE